MVVPTHVAIIMDGNGRWARLKGRPRIYGHIRGSSKVRPVVRECGRLGIKYLTLYAFSAENWGRPQGEVKILMRILEKYLIRERKTLMANNVRLRAIGDLNKLPDGPRKALTDTMTITSQNTGLTLTFALSYGARQEMLDAVQNLVKDARDGILDPDSISSRDFEKYLSTSAMPDPDLIIRTSGEARLSNFLLWQAAYSEFYFTNVFWPDFTIDEFHKALEDFSRRTRRFGLTDAQIPVETELPPGEKRREAMS